jgi:hypothetical protein
MSLGQSMSLMVVGVSSSIEINCNSTSFIMGLQEFYSNNVLVGMSN